MGTLRKAVVLSEGAKPGIPIIKMEKIDHGSVEMTIMVRMVAIALPLTGVIDEW